MALASPCYGCRDLNSQQVNTTENSGYHQVMTPNRSFSFAELTGKFPREERGLRGAGPVELCCVGSCIPHPEMLLAFYLLLSNTIIYCREYKMRTLYQSLDARHALIKQ